MIRFLTPWLFDNESKKSPRLNCEPAPATLRIAFIVCPWPVWHPDCPIHVFGVPVLCLMTNLTQLESEAIESRAATVVDKSAVAGQKPLMGRLRDGLRLVFSFPAMLIVLLAGLVFAFARHGVGDPDIWWHLRNAQYLFIRHQFLRVDLYSFTVIGKPWVNPEWLAEVPYYLGWRVLGQSGILGLTVVILTSIFFGLVYLCWLQNRNVKATLIACYLAVLLATVNFGPRTILFGYADLVLLLIILERFRLRGSGPLWLVPLLFCLWINTHGSWSLGLVVFGIVIAGGLVEGQWGKIEAIRWLPSQLRKLLVAFGASIAALFVNPYGYRLVFYPLDLAFRQRLNISHVAEWVSVDFHNARGKIVLILIVALLLTALLSGYRWQLYELALLLFGLYSGLTYTRFLFLLAILAAPLLANVLAGIVPHYRREIDKPVLNAVLMAATIVLIVRGFPSKAQLSRTISRGYPADVLPYLRSHPPSGPVLNYYNWGGYLIWKDRKFKDFVDSRVDVFEYSGVFQDYIDLIGLENPQAVLDKYGIRYVLFPRNDPLTYVLEQSPRWKVVFRGNPGMLLERVGQTPKPALPSASVSKSALAW